MSYTSFVICYTLIYSVKRILLEKSSAYGWEERCIQGFGGETWGKVATWKTQT